MQGICTTATRMKVSGTSFARSASCASPVELSRGQAGPPAASRRGRGPLVVERRNDVNDVNECVCSLNDRWASLLAVAELGRNHQ